MSATDMSSTNADVETIDDAPPDEEDEELDPRIKENLDLLNYASDEINRLEKEQDEVRQANRLALGEFSQQCQAWKKKFGKSIEKSAPYFEARVRAKKAHIDNQRAAIAFEKASDHLKAAKKTVSIAEKEMLTAKDGGEKPVFNQAWQDTLNQATIRVLEAERAREKSSVEYQKTALQYEEARRCVATLLSKFRGSINKSTPFYEARARHHQKAEAFRKQIMSLMGQIKAAKAKYSRALENLEMISQEIHESRQAKKLREKIIESELKGRDMGDGAEEDVIQAELEEVDGAARSLALSLGLQPGSQFTSLSSLRSDQYQQDVDSLTGEDETPSSSVAPSSRKVSGESDTFCDQ